MMLRGAKPRTKEQLNKSRRDKKPSGSNLFPHSLTVF